MHVCCAAEGSASGLQMNPSSDQLSSLFLPSFSLSQQQETRAQPPPQQAKPQDSSAAQQPVVGLWDQQGSPQMSDTFGPLDSHPQHSNRKRPSESNAFSASIEATAAKRGEAAGAQPDQQGGNHQRRPSLHDTDALLLDGQLGMLENDWQLAKSLNAMSVEDGTQQKGAALGQQHKGQSSGRGTLQPNPDGSTGQQQQRQEGVRRLALSGLDLPLPSMTAQQPQARQHQNGVLPTFRPPAVAGGGCTWCLPTDPFFLYRKLQATSCGDCMAALDA